MPPFGRTYQPFIAVLGVWIAIVFIAAAVLTGADRRTVHRALLGGACAGAVNVALDAIAHHFGWWRYPDATTPFAPLVFYVESGLGFAVFALVTRWLHRRDWRWVLGLVMVLAVYGPIRDHRTQELTGLIEFESGIGIVLADVLFEWLLPYGVAVAVTGIGRESP